MKNQVKIRGFRIELSEIESTLNRHPSVEKAVVIIRGENSKDKRLAAYATLKSGKTLGIKELRAYLETTLPDYMIPNSWMVLDVLPLTPNGKIDRKQLPEAVHHSENDYVAPQTKLELAITDIWKNLLKVDKIGVEDNFFALGGHSLLLVQMQQRLQALTHQSIAIVELFRQHNIRKLAAFFASSSSEKSIDNFDRHQQRALKQHQAFATLHKHKHSKN